MTNYLASVDAGNGGTNAVVMKQSVTSYRPFYAPSVRAVATGDRLGLDQFEMKYGYVDWYGNRYVVGDDVTTVTKRHLEHHMGQDRYGGEFHQFLVANALAQLGIGTHTGDTVDITLFAPPSLYNKVRKHILEAFCDKDVQITLKGDKKPREWTYRTVNVLPEGIGAFGALVIQQNGTFIEDSPLLSGSVVVLDVGLYTTDVLVITDGNFNPETLQNATHQNAGINIHLREPLLKVVHDFDPDFTVLTVDDIDKMFRADKPVLQSAGKEMDVSRELAKYAERYAEWLANNIIDSQLNGLRGIKRLIVCGGGAHFVTRHLKGWYGDKVADIGDVEPSELNAVGGLRIALAQRGS